MAHSPQLLLSWVLAQLPAHLGGEHWLAWIWAGAGWRSSDAYPITAPKAGLVNTDKHVGVGRGLASLGLGRAAGGQGGLWDARLH